jgi:hypothetical protein
MAMRQHQHPARCVAAVACTLSSKFMVCISMCAVAVPHNKSL